MAWAIGWGLKLVATLLFACPQALGIEPAVGFGGDQAWITRLVEENIAGARDVKFTGSKTTFTIIDGGEELQCVLTLVQPNSSRPSLVGEADKDSVKSAASAWDWENVGKMLGMGVDEAFTYAIRARTSYCCRPARGLPAEAHHLCAPNALQNPFEVIHSSPSRSGGGCISANYLGMANYPYSYQLASLYTFDWVLLPSVVALTHWKPTRAWIGWPQNHNPALLAQRHSPKTIFCFIRDR